MPLSPAGSYYFWKDCNLHMIGENFLLSEGFLGVRLFPSHRRLNKLAERQLWIKCSLGNSFWRRHSVFVKRATADGYSDLYWAVDLLGFRYDGLQGVQSRLHGTLISWLAYVRYLGSPMVPHHEAACSRASPLISSTLLSTETPSTWLVWGKKSKPLRLSILYLALFPSFRTPLTRTPMSLACVCTLQLT